MRGMAKNFVGDIHAGLFPSCHDGSGLSVLFNHIITGYFCTPQKATVGMYSRCDYHLFVYFLILPSLLHFSILFNCFYTCNIITVLIILLYKINPTVQ